MTKEILLNAFNWRFACKKFNGQKISNSDLDFLLEAIRLSPSSFGFQPFQVLVINKREILDQLMDVTWGAKSQLPGASNFIVFLTRNDLRYDSAYIDYMNTQIRKMPPEMLEIYRPKIKTFQEKDFDLLSNPRYLSDWAAKQAYLALGNLMTAAATIKIDSCAIEGFSIKEFKQFLVQEKLIDGTLLEPCVACVLGYRLEEPTRPKTRLEHSQMFKII